MGMTIDEAIKQLTTYSIPCGKYKNAYDMAINIMRKYRKIEQALNSWHMNCINDREFINTVREAVEDGNDD